MPQQLFAFLFFFSPRKYTKCVLTTHFSKQGRLSLTRKTPHSRGDLQSAHSMHLLGIKSWRSPCVCWMTITNILCHHTTCLCSCIALQPLLKQTEWEMTPYALVPHAQIKIVLPLKTTDAGCTLTQSIGYRGLTTAWRKWKLCTINYACVCAPAPTFPTVSGRTIRNTIHPKPVTVSKAIHHRDANPSTQQPLIQ